VADLKMPGMDGMALQRALAESGNPLPVVFLTGHGDIRTSVRAIRDGAEDFLVKTVAKEELIAAIDRALARDACERKDRTRRQNLKRRFARLTPRENEVLAHVLSGRLNKEIAADLGIAERSVKRHRMSLMQKLNAKSVVELTQLAEEAKIRDTSTVSGNAPPRRSP
jgi:FixJ family two-component response regulator